MDPLLNAINTAGQNHEMQVTPSGKGLFDL